MEFIDQAILHAAGQWWIYPVLLVFFFVDGFAMVVPSETLIVALAAYSRHAGEPNLWILGLTALVGAMAGDNMAYMLGRKIGLDRWRWMRRPKVRKVFEWADYELQKRGAVLIFTARYIPWGRVAVNYVAGTTANAGLMAFTRAVGSKPGSANGAAVGASKSITSLHFGHL